MFGLGDLIVLNSDGLVIISESDIFGGMLSICLAFLSLFAIACMSICFSVFSDNSIGPIVSTMAVIILFTIIGSLDVPTFQYIQPLITTHMASRRSLFEIPVPISEIYNSIYILMVHIILFIGIAVWKFKNKDIKS